MGGGDGGVAAVEGIPVNEGSGMRWELGFGIPVGSNALELEVGGEVIGEVAGDEVTVNPDAVALEGKYREVGWSIGGLELVAEGFGGLVRENVELFNAGEGREVKQVILVALDVVKFPFDGTEVDDVPNRLDDVGVESIGIGDGVLVADGIDGTFPIAMEMNSS